MVQNIQVQRCPHQQVSSLLLLESSCHQHVEQKGCTLQINSTSGLSLRRARCGTALYSCLFLFFFVLFVFQPLNQLRCPCFHLGHLPLWYLLTNTHIITGHTHKGLQSCSFSCLGQQQLSTMQGKEEADPKKMTFTTLANYSYIQGVQVSYLCHHFIDSPQAVGPHTSPEKMTAPHVLQCGPSHQKYNRNWVSWEESKQKCL